MKLNFAQKLVKTVTPDTFGQAFIGFCALLFGIVALNFAFHRILLTDLSLPWTVIVLNALVVGGPFAFFASVIGMLQVRTLRDLSLRSRKDGLTNLNNRRTFLRLAQQRIASRPNGMLLLLDADHFKQVNDTYGHATGDDCLKAIAEHLNWNLRPGDVAGRLGGEEFAVYLAGVGIEQGRSIGARLTRPIPYPGGKDGEHLCITLSVGGVLSDGSRTLDRMLICADNALYAAKRQGRARLVIYDKTYHADRVTDRVTDRVAKEAVDRGAAA